MSEWKEYRLGDLIEYKKGFAFKSSFFGKEGDIVVRVSDTTNNSIDIDSCPRIRTELTQELKNYRIIKNDIIISTVGSWPNNPNSIVGKVIRVPIEADNALLNQNTVRLRANENKFQLFLYYRLKCNDFSDYLISGAQGSANQASITLNAIFDFKFRMPKNQEVDYIIDLLGSLDEKIDLLNRQNKTLEKLAETLFRKWFVEGVEEHWEVAKLGVIAVVQNGYAFGSKDYVTYQEGHLEVLKMGHIAVGGGLRTNPKKDFVPREDKFKRWTLNKNDIIMGMTDMKDNVVILGVPAMIDKTDKYVLNQRVARIYLESNEKLINSYLLYIQLKNKEFIATLQSKANSGVQVNLSTEAIKDCDIIIPPMLLQKEKGATITDLYLKKENNDIQIQTLTKLRDTLLPKLMSGEVRIEN